MDSCEEGKIIRLEISSLLDWKLPVLGGAILKH